MKKEFKLKGAESAYRVLELELKRHKYRDDAIVYELLKDMADRRLLYRFSGGYIGRLIEAETGALLRCMHLLRSGSIPDCAHRNGIRRDSPWRGNYVGPVSFIRT